jgi:exopolysaccharide production protein ExoY
MSGERRSVGHFEACDSPMATLPQVEASSPLIRALDIIVALAAIIWLAPLLLVVGLFVKFSDGGSMLFAQHRVGRNGKLFRCFKFRTMVVDAEQRLAALLENDPAARAEWDKDHKLRNDPRIIPLGSFLRKWSLDELPQFFNVLRGEMSIVGPRPIVPGEVVRYGRHIRAYHSCRPGITGLWQISGRNDVSYRRRVACDVLYSRSRSVQYNVRIIMMTVVVVLTARGSY